ncbi:hypothetical protein GGH94_005097 [Coemansia aciculifera]|uniref:DNA-directed RNA polymerase I, subunit RPA34.5 n=1 Tax=Coemansia aciculifera TaxID=417176 RepID=A0A9W8IKP1_9FUNG|nr:hypothetical protein GGH94_005097 [Coemansia aciculifera]KAJ2871219.1 hypothetical protein GGH93_004999 [Coemansia aciculifera]
MSSKSTRYEPPADFYRQKGVPAAHFKHSAITNDGKELWLLRVPDNVSLKDLDGLKIKHPKSAVQGILAETTASSGAKSTYQIISSDAASGSAEFKGMAELNILLPDDDEDDEDDISLTLLPNRCTHLLSMVEKIDIPDSKAYAKEISVRERPPRQQPDNMKLRFIPYGFYSAEDYASMDKAPVDIAMPDVNADVAAEEPPRKKKKTKTEEPSTTDEIKKKDKKDKDKKKDKKPKKEKS